MDEAERSDNETGPIRARLDAAMEKAKGACEHLDEKTAAAAKAADKALREYPYQALGIALGIGVLVGVLIARGWRD